MRPSSFKSPGLLDPSSPQRELAAELADYLAKRLDGLRLDEASASRVLRELVKNQRLG